MDRISRLEKLNFFDFTSLANIKVVPMFGLDMSIHNIYDEDNKLSFHDKIDKSESIYYELIKEFRKVTKFISTEFTLPFAFG